MRKKAVWGGFILALLLASPALAQVTIPNTFTANTTADPDQVNANFTQLGNQALNRTGGTMTGTLTSQTIAPSADATYALGDGAHRFTTGSFSSTVTANGFAGDGSAVTNLAAGNIATGTIATARLGSGSAQAVTFLSGASSWAIVDAPRVTAVKTTPYSASDGDYVVCNGTFTVTLPSAASAGANAVIDVKNIGTGTITIARSSTDTIDGATSQSLVVQYQSLTLISDGSSAWYIR